MRIIKPRHWIPVLILIFFLQLTAVVFYSTTSETDPDPGRKVGIPAESPPDEASEKEGVAEKKDQEEKDKNKDKKDRPLSFLFFGDMMLDRNVGQRIEERGLEYILGGLATSSDILKERDIVGANLEGAVTDNGEHYPPVNAYDFAFSPELVEKVYKDYGFNFFNIANNHLADQGEKGVRETRDNLTELGVHFTGCRDGRVGDCSLERIDVQDKEIALLGFSMVYSTLDRGEVARVLQEASSSDLVLVSVHWGVEYEHYSNSVQKDFGRFLIDNGADVVIGHHPHVVQGMEIYKNRPVFYSLGNFVFDQYFSSSTQEGLAVEIEAEKDKLSFSLHPLGSEHSRVNVVSDREEKEDFFRKFFSWSSLGEEMEDIKESGEFEIPLDRDQ